MTDPTMLIREDFDAQMDAVPDDDVRPIDLPEGEYLFAIQSARLGSFDKTGQDQSKAFTDMPLLVIDGPQRGQVQKHLFLHNTDNGIYFLKKALTRMGLTPETTGTAWGGILLHHLPRLVGQCFSGKVIHKPKNDGSGVHVNAYINTPLPTHQVPPDLRKLVAWPQQQTATPAPAQPAPTSDVPDISDPFADQ